MRRSVLSTHRCCLLLAALAAPETERRSAPYQASIRTRVGRSSRPGACWCPMEAGAAISVAVSHPFGFRTWRNHAVTRTRSGVGSTVISFLLPLFRLSGSHAACFALRSGSYTSPVFHSAWSNTASLRAVAITALFFAAFPPRSTNASPRRLRSESSPNGPRM